MFWSDYPQSEHYKKLIRFKDSSYDESKYARAISKHLSTDHTEVLLEEDDCK